MIVALHSAPKDFFRTNSPHANNELAKLVRKVASLGFKAVQIGPLQIYLPIEGEQLRRVLDSLNMERNVHVGGIFDAEKLAMTEDEYVRMRNQVHYGTTLCKKVSSTLLSIHPPFFVTKSVASEILLKARTHFLELVMEEVDFASRNNIKMALESFCYNPFIFGSLHDFARFVSEFPEEKLGVLLDAGHLYQMGIDLSEAVHLFRHRLLDVHVHDATLGGDVREATHLPIGKGTIDFPDFIGVLQDVGYNGWLTLEIRGSEKEIVEGKDFLESLMMKHPNT